MGRAATQPRTFGAVAVLIILATYAIISGKVPTTQSAYADSTRVVSLFADGQKRVFTTDATTVGDVLNRTHIQLGPHDLVEPGSGTKIPVGFYNINVYRARSVVIADGVNSKVVETAHASPRLMAEDAGIKVFPEDEYQDQFITNFVGDGSVGEKVTILRAKPVTLSVDGTTKTVRTQATNVGQLLKGTGIPMGAKDTISQPLSSPVLPGTELVITRVTDVTLTQHVDLPFSTKIIKDPNLYVGQSQVVTPGLNGGQDVTYHLLYHNGVEIERKVLGTANLVKPVTQVVHQGTKVQFGGSIEYWRPWVSDAASANGVDPNLMLAIMNCESHGNANASNGTHFGLYQYDYSTWAGVGGSSSNIFDGPTQITKTAWKIANYGTNAWLASKACWANY